MTSEEIIALAKEAHIEFQSQQALNGQMLDFTDGSQSLARMTRFAELVAAKEREACARLCDGFDTGRRLTTDYKAAEIAAAIRARGQKEGA